jgi:hypothetical protein
MPNLPANNHDLDFNFLRHPSGDANTQLNKDPDVMATQMLPLELIDKCVGSKIHVIMKGDKGTLHSLLLR